MKIIYLTAGAAGMYCGSCLHDNAIAKSMIRQGHDALLVPTYTPILTDEQSVSSDQLFFGGLNVYLQQMSSVFRLLPRWTDSFLSSPKLVRWIANRSMGTTADKLGPLTISMLRGAHGNQSKEVARLCDWLESEKPDVVVFSNLLIAGCIETIKQRLECKVAVVLQGDDIFYDSLLPEFRENAIVELRRIAKSVDRFILNSEDYARRMQELLGFEAARCFVTPLSIDVSDFLDFESLSDASPASNSATVSTPTAVIDAPGILRVGYLARLAPEKGLHVLVDAFIRLASTEQFRNLHLEIAGWLGPQHQEYWNESQTKLRDAGLEDRFCYHGSVDRGEKLDFLRKIDLLCVPTTYQEPKGLFALEAMAAGVPVLLPSHGAFPELIAAHGGGELFSPSQTDALVDQLKQLLSAPEHMKRMGAAGRDSVLSTATSDHEAGRWLAMLSEMSAQDAE